MKNYKILMLATILSFCGTTAMQAQTKYYNTRNEIGLTIGGGSNSELLNMYTDIAELLATSAVTTSMTGGEYTGHYRYGKKNYIPTIGIEYFYHLNKVVGLGGIATFNGMSRDMYATWVDNKTGITREDKTGEARRQNISILPAAKFDWLRRKNIGLYSKLAAGVTIMHESQQDDAEGGLDYNDTDVLFNFQLSLIGFEAGSENWRGFAELGFGEQGIALIGVKYKF